LRQTKWLRESLRIEGKTKTRRIQSASIVKLMQQIATLRGRMIQEFEHSVESQLIEVMKMKMTMLRIQLALIVNLIQMKQIRMIDTLQNMKIQEFQSHKES
jgi:hypothetical protein